MPTRKAYIRKDKHGVLRVGRTRLMLDSVVAAFLQGHSPETIVQQYPALTLEEAYGAILYYLVHQGEVNEYLRRQDECWQRERAAADAAASPVLERLRRQLAKTANEAR